MEEVFEQVWVLWQVLSAPVDFEQEQVSLEAAVFEQVWKEL